MADIQNYFDLPDWRQQSGAKAVGGAVRNTALRLPGYAIGAAGAAMDTVAPVVSEFGAGLAGRSAPTQNAPTQNAVRGPSVDPNTPAGPTRQEENAYNAFTSYQRNAPGGGSVGVTPQGALNTSRDVGGGITRYDTSGNSPLYTNMGAAGLDDINRKGSVLPSVAGFLSGVRNFGEGGVTPGSVPQSSGGGGGVGMVPPHVYANLNAYEDEARPLLSSKGIVDRLRGRQLMRARGRMAEGYGLLHGADSASIVAEAARLRANTEARATEQTQAQNLASNNLRQFEIDTQRRGHEMQLAPHLPAMARSRQSLAMFNAGDPEGALQLESLGRFAPLPRTVPTTDLPGAQGVLHGDKFTTYKDLALQGVLGQRKKIEDARVGQ